MNIRPSIAAVYASAWLMAPRLEAQDQIKGGEFAIDVSKIVSNGAIELIGGDFSLQPIVGLPNLGEPSEGGGFSLEPGPIFTPFPVPIADLDLSRAHAFPVPFRPSLGHTKITFAGLTANSAISVYTIAGERVKTLTKSNDAPTLDWNPVSNENGEKVASGLYLFVVKNTATGEQRHGKIIVIR